MTLETFVNLLVTHGPSAFLALTWIVLVVVFFYSLLAKEKSLKLIGISGGLIVVLFYFCLMLSPNGFIQFL